MFFRFLKISPLAWGGGTGVPVTQAETGHRKERKCPPLLQAVGTTANASLFKPSDGDLDTPAEARSMREGRAAQNKDIQGVRFEVDLASGLGRPHPLDFLGFHPAGFQSGRSRTAGDSNSHWPAP